MNELMEHEGGRHRGRRTLQGRGSVRDAWSKHVDVRHHSVRQHGIDGYNADAIPELHCTVCVNVCMSTGRDGVIQET